MDLIASGVAAAGLKAAGGPLGALIGRYRPTGVPRLGSREDRVGVYRRMLDASTRSFAYSYQFANLRREAGRASYKLLTAQMPAMWEVSSDLISALNGVRLCGSVQVIDAAEKLVTAAGDLDLNERKADRFQLQAKAVVAAQTTFLDTCREEVSYNARWYQILRKRKEKRFLRQLAAS
ncbi:hypothetical protein [Streptomyces microflavus]|uniref:hypothetical protein n=1 Tax=Streptomyces microflavus TaxID=1919 RepID=UPI00386F6987|nr:hypothetical protein OG721_00080 [Streptomyces microflavus]WST19575.1 hypothetical protein OG721_39020 [Streptomyces microflavus]